MDKTKFTVKEKTSVKNPVHYYIYNDDLTLASEAGVKDRLIERINDAIRLIYLSISETYKIPYDIMYNIILDCDIKWIGSDINFALIVPGNLKYKELILNTRGNFLFLKNKTGNVFEFEIAFYSRADILEDLENKHKEVDKVELGCLMVPISGDISKELLHFQETVIDIDDLSEYGIEKDYHVTLLYGFKPDTNIKNLKNFIHLNIDPFKMSMGAVSSFENPDYDVLYIDITSSDILRYNKLLVHEFSENLNITYPNYKPHLTIAYLKRGAAKKYVRNTSFIGYSSIAQSIVYSDSKNNKTFMYLDTVDEMDFE